MGGPSMVQKSGAQEVLRKTGSLTEVSRVQGRKFFYDNVHFDEEMAGLAAETVRPFLDR